MSGTRRIRWEPDGDVLFGYCGARMFTIWPPDEDDGEWLLTASLPDHHGIRFYGTTDELKAEAERWLERFVSSLGASFKDADELRGARLDWAREVQRLREMAERPRQLVGQWRDAADSLKSTNAAWSSHFYDCANELERLLAAASGRHGDVKVWVSGPHDRARSGWLWCPGGRD